MNKTNAMRHLDQEKVSYQVHEYSPKDGIDAKSVSRSLNEREEQVFKTLVTIGKSHNLYVFVIPSNAELSLKKAASSCGEKNVEMLPQKELLSKTGYVHGGCSPLGMKKLYPTYVDISAREQKTIFVSGGKIGLQIEIAPDDLIRLVDGSYADIKEKSI